MLNEMRLGTLTNNTIAKFRALDRRVTYNDGIEPTELCAPLFRMYLTAHSSCDLGSLLGERYMERIIAGSNNCQESRCHSQLPTNPGPTLRAFSSR